MRQSWHCYLSLLITRRKRANSAVSVARRDLHTFVWRLLGPEKYLQISAPLHGRFRTCGLEPPTDPVQLATRKSKRSVAGPTGRRRRFILHRRSPSNPLSGCRDASVRRNYHGKNLRLLATRCRFEVFKVRLHAADACSVFKWRPCMIRVNSLQVTLTQSQVF